MNKTPIVMGALVALTFAHAAVGWGGQDCVPESQHLSVLPNSADVFDGTGTLYAVTGTQNPDPTGTTQPTLGNEPLGPATNDVGAGIATVTDSNLVGDCNGDGTPGDYDGDLDVGVGGFFFGSGMTWEALCAYGHNVHATTGVTADVLVLPYTVSAGIDDPSGPTPPVYDPATGQEVQPCQTDGVIAANPGAGPSPDGDCLDTFVGNGAYGPICGGGVGGDDGYWIFVQCQIDAVPPSVDCPVSVTATTPF